MAIGTSPCPPFSKIGGIFKGLSAAWPLSEAGIRREVLGSGIDFYPVGATSVGGFTHFDGVNDHIVCEDGSYKLGADTSFTFAFSVKPTAIVGTKFIITKGRPTAAIGCEYYVYRTGGIIYFRLCDGAVQVTVSDPAHLLVAGVETKVVFGFDSVNNLMSLKIGNNAPVTTPYLNATWSVNFGLVIGTDAYYVAGNYFDGDIRNIMIWSGRYLTPAEQTVLYNSPFPFTALPAQAITLDPDTVSNKYSRYDFSDITTQYQDVAKTTPVAVNNDPIRVIESLWNVHDLTAPNDLIRPLHQTAILGGLGCGYWNGLDSELLFDASTPGNADFTMFLIAKNDRNASLAGSQIFGGTGSAYLTYTGSDYPVGCYAVAHTFGGTATQSNFPMNNPVGFNISEVIRKGNVYKMLQCGEYNEAVNTSYRIIASDFNINRISWGFSAAWWFLGHCAEILIFTRALSAAERYRIRAFLVNKWTLPNVTYWNF